LVAGQAADDVGLNCGGWTVTWMGSPGATVPGTTPLEGIRAHAGEAAVQFEADAQGDATAEVGIVFVHEEPYAEGMGDRHSLQLGEAQQAIVRRVRARTDKLVLMVVSGRPIVLGEAETHADAVVAAWLPGSEAAGVADPLFGRTPYRGVLRYEWPASDDDLPLHPFGGGGEGRAIWRIGDGVTTRL
jgi:beta-glucosidase